MEFIITRNHTSLLYILQVENSDHNSLAISTECEKRVLASALIVLSSIYFLSHMRTGELLRVKVYRFIRNCTNPRNSTSQN